MCEEKNSEKHFLSSSWKFFGKSSLFHHLLESCILSVIKVKD